MGKAISAHVTRGALSAQSFDALLILLRDSKRLIGHQTCTA